jgi:hypothetical protein
VDGIHNHNAEAIAMSQEKPNDDPRQQTDTGSFKQSDKPWKQPAEKEQNPKGARKSDLEKWQQSDTH